MAAQPLFVASYAAMVASLRLTGAVNTSAGPLIDDAIMHSRLDICARLQDQVATILTFPVTTSPLTQNERIRARASLLEIMMVRRQLLRTLPTMFIEGNSANAQWNDENLARMTQQAAIDKELERLDSEIELAFSDINLSELDTASGVQVFDGTPDCKPRPVGRSIYGRFGRGFGDSYGGG